MARSVVLAIVITYALAVLQVTIGTRLALAGVAPDLLLVWTLCIGLLAGPRAGMVAGFACGALEGALLQSTVGALAISKGLSGLAAGQLGTRMSRENWLTPTVAAGLLTVLSEVSFRVLSHTYGDWGYAGRALGVRMVYHAALAPLAFAAILRARRAMAGWRGGQLHDDA